MKDLERSSPQFPDWLVLNRNFVLLWAAYGISAIGDHLSEKALLHVLEGMKRPDSARIQALIQFGFGLPFILMAPVAGWWGDRFSRKWTMVASDILRAIVMINLSIVVPFLLARGFGDYSAVIPLGVAGALAAFFSPARQAMLPTLVRSDQLVRANAMISALGTIGTITSAVLGGWLVLHYGPVVNYRVDAITFLLSAVLVGSISLRQAAPVSATTKRHGVFEQLAEGVRYLAGHRRILEMILLGSVFWASAGIVKAFVPALVREIFHGDIADVGYFEGVIAIGLVLGSVVMTIVGPTLPLQLGVPLALAGAAFWVLALDVVYLTKLGKYPTAICLLMIGAHGAGLLVSIMATIQRFVPDGRRGRVFGVSDLVTFGAFVAASAALALPRISNLDRYAPYLLGATSAALAGALVVAWRTYRRQSNDPFVARWLTVLVIKFYAAFWCRMKRVGRCTIPRSGPTIVAANHTTGIDPLMIVVSCNGRFPGFIVEEKHYRTPLGYFMKMIDCIPVNRQKPGKEFLATCLRRLQTGGCVGIFPQGTFEEPGGDPLEPRSGVGLLALRTGATVIPVHISGQTFVDSPFGALLKRHRVEIRYGPPVDLSAFSGRERDRTAPSEASEVIMAAIRALGEQAAKRDTDSKKKGEP